VIETRAINYREADATLNGFLAVDGSRRDPRPGILVVHGGGLWMTTPEAAQFALPNGVLLLLRATCTVKASWTTAIA
jgi:hypothetical protein